MHSRSSSHALQFCSTTTGLQGLLSAPTRHLRSSQRLASLLPTISRLDSLFPSCTASGKNACWFSPVPLATPRFLLLPLLQGLLCSSGNVNSNRLSVASGPLHTLFLILLWYCLPPLTQLTPSHTPCRSQLRSQVPRHASWCSDLHSFI